MKNSTLKVALVAVATFIGFTASAQPWHATQGDYTLGDTTTIVNNKVTINKAMPFWVYPSVAYNPAYVAPNATHYTPVASITANVLSSFTWTLNVPANGAVMTQTNANNNYVELSFDKTGVQKIGVVETPAGGGVCPGKMIRYDVNVIDVPAANISNAVSTTYGLGNVIAAACDGDATLATTIDINLSNANEEAPYYVNLGYKVYTVDALDGSGDIPHSGTVLDNVAAGVTDYTASSSVTVFGQDGTTVPSATNPIVINATPVVGSHASCGFFSPVADNNATRLYMASILYFLTIAANFFPSNASSSSSGPSSPSFMHGEQFRSAATTWLFPYMCLR